MLFVSSAIITAGLLFWSQFFFPRGASLTPIFQLLFLDLDAKAASWMLAVLVIAVLIPRTSASQLILRWISRHIKWIAVTTVVLLSAGTLGVYLNHPLSMDEYAAFFQSQIFAAGRLTGNFPTPLMDWLVPPVFQNYFITASKVTGVVASGYWPSFALIMAPFSALGIPWACNPVISALTLLVAHRLALKIYDSEDAAAWVVLFTASSPEFLINGISYYSMPAHLLANAFYALLLLEPTRSKALLAGCVGSVALTLHNPLPHVLFAIPWIVWLARRADGGRTILALFAGYVPLCVFLGVGWLWFTLHVRQVGMPAAVGGGILDNAYQTLSVFSLPDASVWLARAVGIAKTWLWAVPGLIILAVVGARKQWSRPGVRLFGYSALLTLLGFFLVPVDQGHGWGYRYFHSAWIVLPILAAGALSQSRAGEERVSASEDDDLRAFVVSCALLTLLVGGAFRAVQVHALMVYDLSQTPAYHGTERRVMLINPANTFYGADLVQNDPWLRGEIIRMISHGREEDARMMTSGFPELHLVYDDIHGAIWSKAPLLQRRLGTPATAHGSPENRAHDQSE